MKLNKILSHVGLVKVKKDRKATTPTGSEKGGGGDGYASVADSNSGDGPSQRGVVDIPKDKKEQDALAQRRRHTSTSTCTDDDIQVAEEQQSAGPCRESRANSKQNDACTQTEDKPNSLNSGPQPHPSTSKSKGVTVQTVVVDTHAPPASRSIVAKLIMTTASRNMQNVPPPRGARTLIWQDLYWKRS